MELWDCLPLAVGYSRRYEFENKQSLSPNHVLCLVQALAIERCTTTGTAERLSRKAQSPI